MINSRAFARIISILITFCLFLLTIVALILVSTRDEVPVAEKGVLDLREWDFSADPLLPLNGSWEYYPGSYYSGPESLAGSVSQYRKVPSFWSSPLLPQRDRFGSAVYHLTVLLPEKKKEISLKIKNITPNYELSVNGRRVTSAGVVSPDHLKSKAGNQTFFESFLCPDSRVDLYVSISNFHNITAGINHEILAGDYIPLMKFYSRSLILESLTLGGILIFSIYIFSTFILDPARKEFFYLALICLASFLFTGLKDEMILLHFFPFLEGEVRSKIIHIIISDIGGFTYFYFRYLFPKYFQRRCDLCFSVYMAVTSFLILLTPMNVHSLFVFPLELIGFGTILILFAAFFILNLKSQINNHFLIQFFIPLFMLFFLVGMLSEALLVSFDSIGQILLAVLLVIVLNMAKEYSGNSEQIEALEDSHEELSRINQELLTISQMDSLTGIANRRYFDQQLLALWEADKFMEKNVGLIMVDIDYFKNYNDYYGHQKGDRCLVKVASGLRNALLRQSDFLARYGGEEFSVILSDLDEEGVRRVAENLRRSIENLNITHEASISSPIVTISVGCSVLPAGADRSLTELISHADLALYKAKERGRNCVEMYENSMTFKEASLEASC